MARKVEYTISLKDLASSKLDVIAGHATRAQHAIESLKKIAKEGSYKINVSLDMRGVTDAKIAKINSAAAALHRYSNAAGRNANAHIQPLPAIRMPASGGQSGVGVGNLLGGSTGLNSLIRGAGAYLAVDQLKDAQMAILNTTASYERMGMAIKVASDNSAQGEISMAWIKDMSSRYGLPLREMTEGFKTFQGAMIGTKFTSSDTRVMFEKFSKGFSAMGLTADNAKLAFLALGQMMSKGTVQAEELRGQLSEHLPGAFQMMAKSLGLTTQQMAIMMKKGEILASDALPKLADEINRTIGKDALSNSDNLTNQMNKVANAWDLMLERMGKSETGFFKMTMSALEKMLNGFNSLSHQEVRKESVLTPAAGRQIDVYQGEFMKSASSMKKKGMSKSKIGDFLYKEVEKKTAELAELIDSEEDKIINERLGIKKLKGIGGSQALQNRNALMMSIAKRQDLIKMAELTKVGISTLPASIIGKLYPSAAGAESEEKDSSGSSSKKVGSADRVSGRSVNHITINVGTMSEVNVEGVNADDVVAAVKREVPKALLTTLNDANILMGQNTR